MKKYNSIAALSVMAILAGCSPEDNPAKKGPPFSGDKLRSTALQFVPALEDDYLRQETSYLGSGQHYRMKKAVQVTGVMQDTQDVPWKGLLRFMGASAGEVLDPASVRFKEADALDGKYDVMLAPGYYAVDIVPESTLLPAQRQFISVDQREAFTYVLSPGLLYQGRVLDNGGTPMAGVSVRVLGDGDIVGSNVVQTNADGEYKLALGPDSKATYKLEFAAPENKNLPRVVFTGLSAAAVTLGAIQTLDIQYLPTTNAVVTGRVFESDTNGPAPDVTVLFSSTATPVPLAARRLDTLAGNNDGQAVFSTKTNGSGEFSITLPQGNWKYKVNFQAPLDRPYGGLTVADYKFPSNTPAYTLKPKQPVLGKVVSPDGEPVVRAEVLISRTVSLRDNQQVIRLYTDELGEFSTTLDTSTGIYDVTVIPLGVGGKGKLAFGRCTRSAVAVNAFAETFIVHEGELSEGYVEDDDGRPVPRVSVTLTETHVGESKFPIILAVSATPSDEQGRFLLVVPKEESLTGCRGGKIAQSSKE